MIYYKRDENNHLVGFRYNYKHYYYIKNVQEDIIGMMDSDNNVIVNYKYDAYGKVISVTDNNGNEIVDINHIAYINPFRYRSYYYDEETKLYYLNSRYYNPEFGRFINADNELIQNNNFIGNNLFVYCLNDPINRIDVLGNYSLKGFVKGIKNVVKGVTKTVTNVAKSVVKAAKKVEKTITKVATSVSSAVTKTGKKIKNGLELLGDAVVFEVGTGVGHGIAVENVGISHYAETTATLKQGKTTCTLSKSSTVGYAIMGTTTSEVQSISCDGKTAYSEFETKNSFNFLFFEFTEDSIFFGFSADGFLHSGGHIKIGIMID